MCDLHHSPQIQKNKIKKISDLARIHPRILFTKPPQLRRKLTVDRYTVQYGYTFLVILYFDDPITLLRY